MIEHHPETVRGKPLARSYDFIVCGSGSEYRAFAGFR